METTNRTTKTPVINCNLQRKVFADKLVSEKNKIELLLFKLGNVVYTIILLLMGIDILL